MQNHMEHIKSLGRLVQLKMSPNSSHSFLQLRVLLFRHCFQHLLQPRDVRNLHLHGECLPPQHIAERQDIVIGENDGDALGVDGLHDSGAGHLVAAGAQTVLGFQHEGAVVHVFGEVLVDEEVGVTAHPVLEEDRPDWAVKPTSKERQKWTWAVGGRRRHEFGVQGAAVEVDFRQAHVLLWVEPF